MTIEDYLIQLSKATAKDNKGQLVIGKLLASAITDKAVTPQVYEAMCNTAKDKGFKFKNIQLT